MVEYIERDIKLETLRHIVLDCDKFSLPALYEQLIIFCSQQWRIRRQSAQELLRELVAAQEIFIDGREVWTFKRWLKIEKARSKDYLKMEDILKGYAQKQL